MAPPEADPHDGGIPFVKGHGTENDFVLLPDLAGRLELSAELVRALCDRHAGVGGDGVLRVVRADAVGERGPEWFMDYRNADGSMSEMCGNGIRVYARYLVDAGLARPGVLRIGTRGGARLVTVPAEGDIAVDMGPAEFRAPTALAVLMGDRRFDAVHVDVGNPHAVVLLEPGVDLDGIGALEPAPVVEPRGAVPHGVNVEFVVRRGAEHLEMRVHERGVGETRSCGTGACAAVVAAARRAGEPLPTTYDVDVPGGRLSVTQRLDGRVELRGPAVLVAQGTLDRAWVESFAAVPA